MIADTKCRDLTTCLESGTGRSESDRSRAQLTSATLDERGQVMGVLRTGHVEGSGVQGVELWLVRRDQTVRDLWEYRPVAVGEQEQDSDVLDLPVAVCKKRTKKLMSKKLYKTYYDK